MPLLGYLLGKMTANKMDRDAAKALGHTCVQCDEPLPLKHLERKERPLDGIYCRTCQKLGIKVNGK